MHPGRLSLHAQQDRDRDRLSLSLWFADANTLYVTDEGDATNTYDGTTNLYSDAAAQTTAGLQKWIFDSASSTWKLAYTLQSGLKLGVPYTVKGFPSGNNAVTGLPWTPATDGLRNFAGVATDDRKVVIWAISSTVSGNGDQGADPNKLYMIVDDLKNTSAATRRTRGSGRSARPVTRKCCAVFHSPRVRTRVRANGTLKTLSSGLGDQVRILE